MTRSIDIVGGGLAGLALGSGLQRLGIATTVHECGQYPRHRTCGEFINGLEPAHLDRLGLGDLLEDAPRRSSVLWSQRGAVSRAWRLPRPAFVVSRAKLDTRLAETFCTRGGTLLTQSRVDLRETPPGRVFAVGRRPQPDSPWLGLKAHYRGMPLGADLEFHVGDRSYVGACRIDDDHVNLCGLFHRCRIRQGGNGAALSACLHAAGLAKLAGRLEGAEIVPGSFCSVAGLSFGVQVGLADAPTIGDAFAFAPPFTGRGMATAFASAATALGPLVSWVRGTASWEDTVLAIRWDHLRLHRSTLRRATKLHPFLLHPTASRAGALLQRAGILPFQRLCRFLHPPSPTPCFYTP